MDRKKNKIDPKKIKAGELMAMVNWVRVKSTKTGGEHLVVEDLDHALSEIEVKGKALVETCFSSSQFAEEQKVTKTQAAEILVSLHNRPLSVCFEKADGAERVLNGRLVQAEPLLGRSHVEDLDIPKGQHRLRLVDHRTIKWIVVDGVKFTVK